MFLREGIFRGWVARDTVTPAVAVDFTAIDFIIHLSGVPLFVEVGFVDNAITHGLYLTH